MICLVKFDKLLTVLYVISFLALVSPNFAIADGTWEIETFPGGNSIFCPSIDLVIDSKNRLILSYIDMNLGVCYAMKDNNTWLVTQIDSTTVSSGYTAIKLDSDDSPHIVYSTPNSYDLYLNYAKKTGSTWQLEAIKVNGQKVSVHNTFSFALDASQSPCIAAITETYPVTNNIVYLTNSSGVWVSTNIPNTNDEWYGYVSLAIDKNDVPHISYCTNAQINYVKYENGTWSKQVVNKGSNETGMWNAIAIDSKNNPHISYEGNVYSLGYSYWDGTKWNSETVDRSADATAIVLDSHDFPIITYFYWPNDEKCAKWNGSSWGITVLEHNDAWYNPVRSKVKVDANDIPYAVWADYNTNKINIGKYIEGAPVTPVLAWTQEQNYTSGGLYPTSGTTDDTFIYRISYSHTNGIVPAAGYPKVHIKKDGAEITGSPFTMGDTGTGTITTGRIYTYAKNLGSVANYTYYFEANDLNGTVASGVPTTAISGPTVTSASNGAQNAVPLNAYPNPFNPSKGTALKVVGLTANSEVTIYTLSGEVVVDLNADGNGVLSWDGKNDQGITISSGIYFALLKGNGAKVIKFAVER